MIRPEPRVSILLPVWNAAPLVGACLASILRQTESRWECVLVDDGSTDGTSTLAQEAARGDARFRVISTPHRGLVGALQAGLASCRAPVIARMDADDVMHRDRLAAQLRALDVDPRLSAVGCHVRIFPRSSMTARLREYERWLNGIASADDVARDAFIECPVAHPALAMRRGLAELGYRDEAWAEDYDLVLRGLAAGHRIGVVPRRLLSWRNRCDSLVRTDARYGIGRFTACKAHFLARGFLAPVERYVLWGYGSTGKALRRQLSDFGKQPSFIVEVKNERIGQRIHGAPVIRPEALPQLRGQPVVVSVAREGPRAEIRAAMAAMGFQEGIDFLCAA